MRVLLLIPARAGSKGLPGKNLRLVGGMSLVARAAQGARRFVRKAGLEDAIVLVDTESEEIAAEGRRWGALVPFLRPPELAQDQSPTIDAALHALRRIEEGGPVDAVILLQPTSPLRTPGDIGACWARFDPAERPSVASVMLAGHPADFALCLAKDGKITWASGSPPSVRRRQGAGESYELTGSVYVATPPFLRQHQAFVVSGITQGVVLERSRSVDVDTAEDLQVAEALAAAPAQVTSFQVGAHRVGGPRCFVIAEAGVNHNGELALAHRLVDVAARAGADAVKFQTFEPDALAAQDAPKAEYQLAATSARESQREMLARLALHHEAFVELKNHAISAGLVFLSTPFDQRSADFLEELGVPAFKIPSGEITNHPLLAHLAGKGRPLVISTGMSSMDEVAAALGVVEANGSPPTALLHCVTNYPAAPGDCNLAAMATMRRAFGVPVGWSDHTRGIEVSCAAVALRAEVLEKHFTTDRTLPGPDHAASLEPEELGSMVAAIRGIEAARGDGLKRPAPTETALAAVTRRSLHARRALVAGQVLSAEDLVALRPGTGISPSRQDEVIGRRLMEAVRAGEILQESNLA